MIRSSLVLPSSVLVLKYLSMFPIQFSPVVLKSMYPVSLSISKTDGLLVFDVKQNTGSLHIVVVEFAVGTGKIVPLSM